MRLGEIQSISPAVFQIGSCYIPCSFCDGLEVAVFPVPQKQPTVIVCPQDLKRALEEELEQYESDEDDE